MTIIRLKSSVGDSAYKLTTKMMKPYPDAKLRLPRLRLYNYRHAATRVVVENAFGRLKGRWCRMQRIRTSSVERARLLCRACFVLHNYTIVDEPVAEAGEREYAMPFYNGNAIAKREDISKILR